MNPGTVPDGSDTVQMCPDEAVAYYVEGLQMVPEMVQDGSGMVQMCPHWAIAYDLQGLLTVLGTVQDGSARVQRCPYDMGRLHGRLLHTGMTMSFYSADTDKSFYIHGRLWFRCIYRILENYLASPMLALHTCALGLDDTLAHLAKAFCHVGCHSLGLGPAINRLDAGKVLWEGTE